MTDKLAIWNKLSKTDPNHTKGFNRSGGFKGTAVKPIYCTQRMTEHFGPCGIGWGVNEPRFEVVRAENEILVYCTVSIWHGNRENVIFGVGGDKCVAARKDGGSFTDDEAFKKAFTDAIGNAMKQLGMSADIHMGLFDDAKYVNDLRAEFSEPQQQQQQAQKQDQRAAWVAKALESIKKIDTREALDKWWDSNKKYIDALTDDQFAEVKKISDSRVGSMKPPAKTPTNGSTDWAACLNDDVPF